MAFLSREALLEMNFKHLGKDVKISDKASIYGASNIEVHDNVRVDDFCILSAGIGGIVLKNHIHIACYSFIIGNGPVFMDDFSALSSRVSIYSSTDDFSGEYMISPVIPSKYKNVVDGKVHIGKHVAIGATTLILPGVTIADGAAIGVCSLVTKDCLEPYIYMGVPARPVKKRGDRLFELEKRFLEENQ